MAGVFKSFYGLEFRGKFPFNRTALVSTRAFSKLYCISLNGGPVKLVRTYEGVAI